MGTGKFEERSTGEKLLAGCRRFFPVVENHHTEKQTLRRNLRSPSGIACGHFDLLLGMDANPVIRHDKRAACLVGHMTSGAAVDAIYRAQSRVIRHSGAMASQTRLFGFGGDHKRRRVPMRIVTISASELTSALAPTLGIFQRCHLIGNQRVVRHRIFDDTGACMTLRAWAHPFGNGKFLRVQYAEISGMRAERD